MRERMIFVTGYFGAPILEEARRIASGKGWSVLDLDALIQEKDGRSIPRLCMMGGEHAYRNAEYEAVQELCGAAEGQCGEALTEQCGSPAERPLGTAAERQSEEACRSAGFVVACGDGILYDEDTRGLLLEHELIIAGEGQPLEELWERAKQDEGTYHAFMKFGTEAEKRTKFEEHHARQKQLFEDVRRSMPDAAGQEAKEAAEDTAGERGEKSEGITIDPMARGFLQIYTGDGKGKTTAALGLAMRAAGAGLRVYIGQFIKEMEYGEIGIIRQRLPEITAELFGNERGCIIDRKPTAEDVRCAQKGLARAEEVLTGGEYDMVILDELTIPLQLGLLSLEDVLKAVRKKPDNVELVITGRNAPPELIEQADLVTDMKEVKHYYQQGVLSRRGIEC